MALWSSNDTPTGAPKFRIGTKGAAPNAYANTMYLNSTPGAFKGGQVIGVYGIDPTEAKTSGKAGAGWIAVRQGMGAVNTIAVNAGGTGFGNLAVGTLSGGDINVNFQVDSTNSTGGANSVSIISGQSPAGRFANVGAITVTQPANGIYTATISAGGTGFSNGDLITFGNGQVNAVASLTTNTTGGITAVTFSTGGRGFTNTLNTTRTLTNATGGSTAGTGSNIVPTIATGSGLTLTITLGGRAGRTSYEELVSIGSINASNTTALP